MRDLRACSSRLTVTALLLAVRSLAATAIAAVSVAAVSVAAFALVASPVAAAQSQAFVYCTDFGSGTIGTVQFGPPRTAAANQAVVCSDAVLRFHQGLLYVIERIGCDNIRVLDPANNFSLVRQFSVGNGSNPYDIVHVSPTKAYVSRYETGELWIVNPQTGMKTGEVSLAGFADADGIPEMAQMALRNGRLFVAVQRVDRDQFFTPTDSSQIVVVDAATDALVDADPVAPGVQGILLPHQNPTTEIVTDLAGDLLVGCTGFYGLNDGGIVRLDPIALAVNAIETTEAVLGGDVNDVIIGPWNRRFAVISDASFNTVCVAYDRTSGALDGPVFGTTGFHLADAEMNDRNELWLSDRTPANPGMRVFNAETLAQLTAGPISLGLPPQSLAFDGSETVSADGGDAGDAGESGANPGAGGVSLVTLLGVTPNPFASEAAVRVRVRAGGPPATGLHPGGSASLVADSNLKLIVHDATGRRVREIRQAANGPGDYVLRWDGRDQAGRASAPGVYSFRVLFAGHVAPGRLVRMP